MQKPKFNRSIKYCYGDNIYHHADDATWIQENSHHSKVDGINEINLTHDTQTDRVLISKLYWYFGANAIDLPSKYDEISSHTRDYHLLKSENLRFKWEAFLKWIKTKSPIGQHGLPLAGKMEEDSYVIKEKNKFSKCMCYIADICKR